MTFSLTPQEQPLCIDFYCGLGGWAEGFLAEGYRVVGFDIERHDYGTGGYPGELVLRDVRSIHGAELIREYGIPAVIVGSSPCQEFSYRAMPWKRAKALPPPYLGMELFQAQFRIQREASEAAGRYISLVVENVRGAQKWVGQAKWHFGSYYLWGDVPALMPMTSPQKFNPDGTAHGAGSWFAIADSKNRGARSGKKLSSEGLEDYQRHPKQISAIWRSKKHANLTNPAEHIKVPGLNFSDHRSQGFNVAAAQRYREGVKFSQSGDAWFDGKPRDKMLGPAYASRSNSRKAASALIAKIPFALANHIARVMKPEVMEMA